MSRNQPTRNRIVVETQSGRYRAAPGRGYPPKQKTGEGWVALSIIGAAVLATFIALYLTSRPYDPMTSTFDAQQEIPQGPLASPSTATPSPSPTPKATASTTPTAELTEAPPDSARPPVDDAAIQAQIEKAINSDPGLAQLDVSTVVESGRVLLAGSVRSAELKQRVERVVKSVKGVTGVDNQLVVIEATP
jgi:hypothetical protein